MDTTHSKSLHIIRGLIIASALLSMRPSRVLAQTVSNGIQVSPAFQEVVLSSEATATASVTLKNFSNQEFIFSLQAIDIRQMDDQGRITLADRPLSAEGWVSAKYIQVPSSPVRLPANGQVVVPAVIANNIELSPGGHYAALVATVQTASDSAQAQVVPALSSFVLVRKTGGEQFNISLSRTSLGDPLLLWQRPSTLELTFSNQGNTHLIPHGLVRVTDMWGRVTHQGVINDSSLYVFPGAQRQVPVRMKRTQWALPLTLEKWEFVGMAQPGEVPYQQRQWLLVLNPFLLVPIVLMCVLGLRRYWLWRNA